MKRQKTALCLLAVLTLSAILAPSALAQSQAKEKPLSDKEVSKLLVDWPAVIDWIEKKGKQLEDAGDGGLPQALLMDQEFKQLLKNYLESI